MPRSSLRELRPFIDLKESKQLTFELVETTDLLQYSLASTVSTFTSAWHLATSYCGLIPKNSVTDKFPYYRAAASSTSSPGPLSRDLSWVLHTQHDKQINSLQQATPTGPFLQPPQQLRPAAPAVRPRRRKFARDALTAPGTILIYNTLLAWSMFQVDVRASSF